MFATRRVPTLAARAANGARCAAAAPAAQHTRTMAIDESFTEYNPEGSANAWAGSGGLAGQVPKPYLVPKKGVDLLHEPLFNKGVRFPMRERDRLALRGLLPAKVLSTRLQVKRFLTEFRSTDDMMAKYTMLSSLQDRNETLFFKILAENITECAPVVYTPTVGEACQKFSAQFRRPRGMYFSAEDRGEMGSMLWVALSAH
jgi:malate dehydrogenase (decarboxylating)